MKYRFNCRLGILCILISILCLLSGCGREIEQTNEELNIYISSYISEYLNYPLRLYQQKYPDIKVNTYVIAEEAEDIYFDNIKSGLMTGNKITDLMLIDPVMAEHCDIYKTEQTGAFIDLNTMLSEDPEYDASQYNKAVLDGVAYDGHQYIYPISYDLPYIASTKERLAELNISEEEFKSLTILDFLQMIQQKQEEYGFSVDEIVSGGINTDNHLINSIFPNWFFSNLVDYEDRKYSLNADLIQRWIETEGVLKDSTDEKRNYDGYMYAAVVRNEARLTDYITQQVIPDEETPVLTCLRDMNGKINAYVWFAAAIPQLSPNQQNAYNFLKVLLSDEVQNYQYDNDALAYDFPGIGTQVMNHATHLWFYGIFGGEEYTPMRNADFAYREEVSGSFLYSEWSKLIMEQAEEYYKGNCSAEQAVESVEKKLKIYVSE